jgi:ATP-dependent RNA helicase DeaD
MDQIVKADVNEEEIEPFMKDINRYFEFVDKQDIIKKIVSLEFGKFLAYYADAPVIEKPTSKKEGRSRGEKEKRGKGGKDWTKGFRKLFINLGKTDGFYPGEMMQFLNKHLKGRQNVGHIELLSKFSYFEVPEQDAKKVMKALNGQWYKNREVRCNDANEGGLQKSRGADVQTNSAKSRKHSFKKNDWMQFVNPSAMKFKGDAPDFSEEGWARRKPKKGKKD